MRLGSIASCALLLVGCYSPWDETPIPKDLTTDPFPNTPPALPTDMPAQGSVRVALYADGAANDTVASFGLPFPQGLFRNEKDISLLDAKNTPVPISVRTLATWPSDGSIRSVLVAFKVTLAAGGKESWTVEYGAPTKSPVAGVLEANPDGPVIATLTPEHYAKSLVSGLLSPASANKRFPGYDAALDRGAARFSTGAFDIDCKASAGRTYYDGPHARYQRFLRTGISGHYRDARREAVWFRASEIKWLAEHTLAIHRCESASWEPDFPMDWGTLRMMHMQGMLDDYLVSGDPQARDALLGMGETYRVNIPALTRDPVPIEATERNLGWTLIALASYYALDRRNEVRDAARALVTRAIAWQNRSESGALEHDIARADPDECGDGPSGASPFMTSILVDGVMDWWLLTGDTALVEPFVRRLAVWYETKAITTDKKAFRYLWNCKDNPYDESDVADLNILINHVFGAAYVLTKDPHWITFGDSMADSGVEAMYAGSPKHFNQASRSFGKYLGYRSLGASP